MRILILTLNFPPDGVSTAHLMGELAESLQDAGHDVSVITTTPQQGVDTAAAAQQRISRRPWSLVGHSQLGAVQVQHIRGPRKATAIRSRLVQWAWFHLASTFVGWRQRRPDVIIAPSPPLTIGLNAWLIGRFGRTPVVYNVQELYPEVAIQLGYVSNVRTIRMLKRLERLVYRLASALVVISQDMADSITSDGSAPLDKVHVIPNFVDTEAFHPISKENDFSREHGLIGRYVVSYAGNMGPAQNLGQVLTAAQQLIDRPDIHFLLVGNGSEWKPLDERIRREHLTNVTMLPYQPYRTAPLIYASSDLCVVPLDSTLTSEALPSKVYKIMSAGRPVLALAAAESSLAEVVADNEAGTVVPPGQERRLADTIRRAADSQEAYLRYGESGRAHVLASRSRPVVMDAYLRLLESVAGSG